MQREGWASDDEIKAADALETLNESFKFAHMDGYEGGKQEARDAAHEEINALRERLAELEIDAKRWKMLAEMEAGMVAPNTLQYYIAHPDKLDYAAHLKQVHVAKSNKPDVEGHPV